MNVKFIYLKYVWYVLFVADVKLMISSLQANPLFTEDLRNASAHYMAKGINVTAFPETAISTFDGKINLHVDNTSVAVSISTQHVPSTKLGTN